MTETRVADAGLLAWDVETEVGDVVCPEGMERVTVTASCRGEALAPIVLPAADGGVAAGVVADAVAARHAWTVLGRFFARRVYPALAIERGAYGSAVVRRGELVLGVVPPGSDATFAARLHDSVGWTVFLQELWGRRDLSEADFYRDHEPEPPPEALGWVTVECSEDLGGARAVEAAYLDVRIGGVPVAAVPAPVRGGRVDPDATRATITSALGFEACWAAVREGLLGTPFDDERDLRRRLADRAAARAARGRDVPLAGAAPGAAEAAAAALGGREGVVLGRHADGPLGSSSSRLVRLPAGAAASLMRAARAAGEPVLEVGDRHDVVVYAPSVLWAPPSPPSADAPPGRPSRGPLGADHFEAVFAVRDPWGYASPYEQRKYEQTAALLPDGRIGAALELACAEGRFTTQLAARARRVLATDLSPLALERARERCRPHENVELRRHDLFKDPIPGTFDVVVCSEVLYFAPSLQVLAETCGRIAGAVRRGGSVVTAHSNLVTDDPSAPGFDWGLPFGARVIGETLAAAGLMLDRELATPFYRVQRYRRPRRVVGRMMGRRPTRVEGKAADEIPDDVLRRFLPSGGVPAAGEPDHGRETHRLPILLYHRIAPDGDPRFRRYRTAPADFARQLEHLRDAGFRSATLQEWAAALAARRPLPGRAVVLTFDDGYQDFADHAAPLLARFGFEANVFLVTDLVGGLNEWEGDAGERLRLMDWDTIRALESRGIRFGGHTATHPRLTDLGLRDVVEELARARATLLSRLRRPLPVVAYPWGLGDEAVARVAGACGYWAAMTSAGGAATSDHDLLCLPRIEMAGGTGLAPLRAHGLVTPDTLPQEPATG